MVRKNRTMPWRLRPFVTVVAVAVVAGACEGTQTRRGLSPSNDGVPEVVVPPAEAAGRLVIPAGAVPGASEDGETYRLPGGQLAATTRSGQQTFLKIKGTLTSHAFGVLTESAATRGLSAAERKALLGGSLAASLARIREEVPVVLASFDGDVGYFSAWVPASRFADLAKVGELPAAVIVNPVVFDRLSIPKAPVLPADRSLGTEARLDSASFSGLSRIGALEFAATLEREIGQIPDGASVLVGVTDTGVTLNHPSFTSADGKSRIEYMKEFTGEGTAYFSPEARFEVRAPTESERPAGAAAESALILSAEYIPSPKGLYSVPVAGKFEEIKEQLILVSPELRSALLAPDSSAKLGVILESALSAPGELVDLNRNGSTEDGLWILALPGDAPAKHRFYVDLSGTGDFRQSKPVSDWNATRQTVKAFAETFGFDVSEVTLPTAKGRATETKVIRAGLVGFDPGNHGSHVSGIIVGRKTIANDAPDTLARGVAPAARLAVNRVCANTGGCGAVEAVIDLAKSGVDIINMSLGGLGLFNDGFDVDDLLYDRLSLLYGTQFFISAGNSGPGRNTVGSPSVARTAISIGASATPDMIKRQYQWPGSGKGEAGESPVSDDFMLFFSSRGPSGAGGFKPNLSAPGTELSAVQLNAPQGGRAGLDVYWGTSMAAPTASGAYALFLDGIRRYNAVNSDSPLVTDTMTLRRILIETARPFDVSRFDPSKGETLKGQYTWIDQGAGMIDLVRAWAMLKEVSAKPLPSSVVRESSASSAADVTLDYDVRVLRKNPNGIDYRGGETTSAPIGIDPKDTTTITRYATGIWLDHAAKDSLVEVHLGRRLPERLKAESDAGDLYRQLVTTQDTFDVETVFYGSETRWLSPGALNGLSCDQGTVSSQVNIIGEGALDVPGGSGPGSAPLRASSLYVCVDRAAVGRLTPGDHGALIKLYRTVGGVREPMASIVVPVYLTVPHEKLESERKLDIAGAVRSFQVKRHYVAVPEGTSLVRVRLEVPEAEFENGVPKSCSAVNLFVLEAGNTQTPPELADRSKSIARSCSDNGEPVTSAAVRTILIERYAPNPGIWDLHVMGRYNFSSSAYKVTVDYANLASSVTAIEGDASALTGKFDFAVRSASFEVEPVAETSEYSLRGLKRAETLTISDGETLRVPGFEGGDIFRSYDAAIGAVTFDTGEALGSDIDLEVLVCTKKSLRSCEQAASSGTATDVETATVEVKPELFYVAVVQGFKVPQDKTEFAFRETRLMKAPDQGTLVAKALSAESAKTFRVRYALKADEAALLKRPEYTSGAFDVVGRLVLRSATKAMLLSLGVTVKAPTPPVEPE